MKRDQVGFTLIELLITTVVLAILIAMAAPSFQTMILNSHSEAVGESLVNAIQVTKTEAVKRGRRVSLCAANNAGNACANDWTNGWIIFVDEAATDEAAAPVVGDVLRHTSDFDDATQITATNNGATNFVRFTSTGQLGRIGGPANTASVVVNSFVEGCQGPRQRDITVGVAGMIDVEEVDCSGTSP
ncbi:GspH/FimT family pseudopilin [Gilvimarinus japonicus]|uniref:Type II secretion system protein H n=1 Tax=Gilvimarinus japonicus TaxID=1796469 RepID=A0ABV7HW00_9GAMM